jgi:hypothetical protein
MTMVYKELSTPRIWSLADSTSAALKREQSVVLLRIEPIAATKVPSPKSGGFSSRAATLAASPNGKFT